jgi:quinol monooxygenase YgiN
MFGLVVRFTCKDAESAEAFDQLVTDTVEKIKALEPGTLVYVSHKVDGQPLQRIFYEMYADRAAFDAHEEQEHTKYFLGLRGDYLASVEVDFLDYQAGKGITE